MRFFEKLSNGTLEERFGANNPFSSINVGALSRPVAVDLDGDTDLDLVVGASDGSLRYFETGADGSVVEKTGAENPFKDISASAGSSPSFVNFDGDPNSRNKLQKGAIDVGRKRVSGTTW